MIIKATQYKTRGELERFILNNFGNDIPKNRESGNEIECSKKDLQRFRLSEETLIYGIKCKLVKIKGETPSASELRDRKFVNKKVIKNKTK